MTTDQGDEKAERPDTSDMFDKVAKVADSRLMTILFRRAAQAYGDYIGEKAEDHVKKLREEERRKNIEDHVNKVFAVTSPPPEGEVFKIIRVERWMKVAADIPLEDIERSAVIEAALESIISKAGDAAEFQEAAENLTNNTARLLLTAPAERNLSPEEGDERGFEQLKSLGLAGAMPGQRQLLRVFGAWIVGTIIGLIVLLGVVRYASSFLPQYFSRLLPIEFIVDAIAISAVITVVGALFITTKYRLTHLGSSLQRSAKRFYSSESKVHKKIVLSAVAGRPWIVWGVLATLFVTALPFPLRTFLPLLFQPPTVIISSPPPMPTNPPSPPPSNATPQGSSQQQQTTLPADAIRKLVEVWDSVRDQMNDILVVTNEGNSVLSNWSQRVKEGENQALAQQLNNEKVSIEQRRTSLLSLYDAYRTYPNVPAVLDSIDAKGFARLSRAFESFDRELQTLRTPSPQGVENTLRPYASELNGALDTMEKWATSTRDFAQSQSDELSRGLR
jgi:hypothetical protein